MLYTDDPHSVGVLILKMGKSINLNYIGHQNLNVLSFRFKRLSFTVNEKGFMLSGAGTCHKYPIAMTFKLE